MANEILIIDKDISHANALGVYLKRKKMNIYTAKNSDEILKLFDRINIKIVLADPSSFHTDFISILKKVKKFHPEVQIIIMAAPEEFDYTMAQLKDEAIHYMLKPVKSAALDMALKQAKTWVTVNNKLLRYEKKIHILQQTQNLFQQLFDEIPCYISVQNKDFRLTATNKMFKRDFGDEIGSHCYQIYKHRGTPCEKCPVSDTFEDGLSHSTEEVVTSKSGKQCNVITWTAPVKDSRGQISQVIEISTNITQIRQLQDHLISLGLMIGSMSHGIKGMLTALDGGIYKLETGLANKDAKRTDRAFEQIKQMAGRIRKMVLEILYYAKSRELVYETVEIEKMAQKAAEDAMAIAIKKGTRLKLDIAPSLGTIQVDPNWIHATLVNFLENAIDACIYDRSKKNHLAKFDVFEKSPNQICFIIKDNGMGMDQETKEKMFTLFFTSKGSQGTGLGLFIANRVICQHGGLIEVDSEPGKGSCFKITLPRKKPDLFPIVSFP
ncbi:MAG: response regulator, partial [Desulfobacterium sp.]|nr:response regulator [Desulfobacterium sp.]MBU4035470.1 response regulator [Pseudomonadota bacterium]